jgi:hypothetical protein
VLHGPYWLSYQLNRALTHNNNVSEKWYPTLLPGWNVESLRDTPVWWYTGGWDDPKAVVEEPVEVFEVGGGAGGWVHPPTLSMYTHTHTHSSTHTQQYTHAHSSTHMHKAVHTQTESYTHAHSVTHTQDSFPHSCFNKTKR